MLKPDENTISMSCVIAKNKKNVFLNKGRFFAYCDSHRFPTELSRM